MPAPQAKLLLKARETNKKRLRNRIEKAPRGISEDPNKNSRANNVTLYMAMTKNDSLAFNLSDLRRMSKAAIVALLAHTEVERRQKFVNSLNLLRQSAWERTREALWMLASCANQHVSLWVGFQRADCCAELQLVLRNTKDFLLRSNNSRGEVQYHVRLGFTDAGDHPAVKGMPLNVFKSLQSSQGVRFRVKGDWLTAGNKEQGRMVCQLLTKQTAAIQEALPEPIRNNRDVMGILLSY
jgi:hypothetical protein